MAQRYRLSQLRIKSDTANRSGFVTENMTSATPDKAVGTTFKNVLVNETGEIVVGEGRVATLGNVTTSYSFGGNKSPDSITTNVNGKDKYTFNVPITFTAPTGGSRLFNLNVKNTIVINLPNVNGSVNTFIAGMGPSENSEHYAVQNTVPLQLVAGGWATATSGQVWTGNIIHEIVVDTGQSPYITGGGFDIGSNAYSVTFIPA